MATNIFEYAARSKIRFQSVKGELAGGRRALGLVGDDLKHLAVRL